MEGTIYLGPVDLVTFEYEADVKCPDHFSIENGDGFVINFFADLEYCRMESTMVAESNRAFVTMANARYSRLEDKKLSIYLKP